MCLCAPSLLRAEAPLTPDRAAMIAREQNAELLAARTLVAEAEGRARRHGRFANPELEAELGAGPKSEGRIELAVTQQFPVTARLRLERKQSAIQIEMAKFEIADRARLIAGQARDACVKLASAQAALRLASKQTSAFADFADSLAKQRQEGFASSLAADEARLAAERSALERDALEAEARLAAAELATALGRSAEAPIEVAELPLPENPPAARGTDGRPDLQFAALAVETGDTAIALAEASRWDDIGVGLFYEGARLASDDGGYDTESIAGVRVSIPLPFWQNGTGAVAEQAANRERRERELAALRLAARNEAATAYRVLKLRFRSARDTGTKLVPAARRQLEAAEDAYARGEIDFESLFACRTRLAEVEASALAARMAYHLAHAKWLTVTAQ